MQRVVTTFKSPKISNFLGHNLRNETFSNFPKTMKLLQDLRFSSSGIQQKSETVETHAENLEQLTKETALQYLNNCGREAYNKSLDARIESQQKLWTKISQQKEILSVDLCNTYLRVCIENEVAIDHLQFLNSLPCKADQTTYYLLLKSSSNLGNLSATVEILSKMKDSGFSVNEEVFNSLVLVYTIEQGLEGANYVLGTMKTAQIPVTFRTNWQILKGLVRRGNKQEFEHFVNIIPAISQHDQEYKELLLTLGLNERHEWLHSILKFFDFTACDRTFLNEIYNICAHLVQRKHHKAAVFFHLTFLEPTTEVSYGKELLNEMLSSSYSIEDCFEAVEKLQEKNQLILHDLAHLTLEKQLPEDSYRVFNRLKELRPHFFWPLFIAESSKSGESGLFKVLEKMIEFKVKPDFDTLNWYILRHMKLDNVDEELQKLTHKKIRLTRREVITPLCLHLLLNDRIDDAVRLCENCKVPLIGEKLIKPLANAWFRSKNSDKIGRLLQIVCETNVTSVDWAGNFVERCLKSCKHNKDFTKLLQLLKVLDQKMLKITSSSCDNLMQACSLKTMDAFKSDIESAIERLLDISKFDESYHIHPRDMNIDQLENHLVELESKKMETRGLLRRLILNHASMGNHERVNELRQIFHMKNYEESAGMKAALFHSLSLGNDLKGARSVFEELKQTFPNFRVDAFKIIDFTTLLVRHDLVSEACFVLNRESKVTKVVSSMDKNCWNLLGACKKAEDSFKIFQILVDKNYCKPSNVILGPILRPYLTGGNVEKLVQTFTICAQKYNVTPLQLEVLCEVIESHNESLLQSVVDSIAKIHGQDGAKMGLLSALAEKELEKPIIKLLQDKNKLRVEDLKNRCQRWVNEDKLLPLKTLDAANKRLSHFAFDYTITGDAIIKLFCNRNDCEGALEYWQELEDNDLVLSAESSEDLLNLLQLSNYKVPERLKKV